MKILVLGSCNIDYVYTMPHIIKPGETLTTLHLLQFPGGKGFNQAIALGRAGARTAMAGTIGADGRFMLELLKEADVDASQLEITSHPTGHAIIQVDQQGQNCIIVFGGANRTLTEERIDAILSGLNPGDMVLLQNEVNLLPYILSAARAKSLQIALNPSPIDQVIGQLDLNLVDVLLINEVEGQAISGKSNLAEILDAIQTRFKIPCIVLTLGGDGALCATAKGVFKQPVFKTNVVDTTAAGDTFTGYFLSAYLSQPEKPDQAIRRATAASAIAVSKKGAAVSIPRADEVDAFLKTLEI